MEGSGTASNISGSTVNPALGLVAGAQESTATNVQWLASDFGTANYTFNLTPIIIGMLASIKSDIHVLTVGFYYRWNWSGGWH